MRKALLVIITAFVLSISFIPSYDTNISIDDQNVQFTEASGSSVIDNANRTQVPFRQTMEQFGCFAGWDSVNKVAIGEKEGIMVKVPIGGVLHS